MPDCIAFSVMYEALPLSSIGRASLSQGWIQEPRSFILVPSTPRLPNKRRVQLTLSAIHRGDGGCKEGALQHEILGLR